MPFVSQVTLNESALKIPEFPAVLKYYPVNVEEPETLDAKTRASREVVRYDLYFDVDIETAIRINAQHIRFLVLPNPPPNPPKSGNSPAEMAAAFVVSPEEYRENQRRMERFLREQEQRIQKLALAGSQVSLKRYFPATVKKSTSPIDKVLKKFDEKSRIETFPKSVITPAFKQSDARKTISKKDKFVTSKSPFDRVTKSITKEKYSLQTVKAKDDDSSKVKGSSKLSKKDTSRKIPKGTKNNRSEYGVIDKRRVCQDALRAKVDPGKISAKMKTSDMFKSRDMAVKASDIIYIPPLDVPKSVTYFLEPKYTTIKVSVTLRREDLDALGRFYVRAALHNARGARVSKYKAFQVSHSTHVNTYITPDDPPVLKASYGARGKIVVSVKQKDFKATKMKVFRRLVPASDGTTDKGTPWVQVLDTPAKRGETTIFKDDIFYRGLVVYRALAYGSNGKPSEDFSSHVVLPQEKTPLKNALTATAIIKRTNASNFIEIRVNDIPDDEQVVTIRLKRYDLTINSRSEKMRNKGKGFVFVGNPKNVHAVGISEAVFEDHTALMGRRYMYEPVGVSLNAGVICGTPYNIEVPIETRPPVVNIDIPAPTTISDSGLDLQFDLVGSFTDFGFNRISDSLANVGQDTLFSDEILKNRQEFGKLINFTVDRENLKTGEIETFGIVEPGSFKDDKQFRKKTGVKEPEFGTKYNYKVTAVVNKPKSLFPDVKTEKVDQTTLNIVRKTISKLASPVTRAKGVIPSTAKQFGNVDRDKIFRSDPRSEGITNIQVSRSFTFSEPQNVETEIKVEEFKDFNRLSWIYDGNTSEIDHFKIALVAGGGKMVIDTLHCDPGIKRFFYRHMNPESSMDFEYEIIPVNLYYKELQPFRSVFMSPVMILDSGDRIRARLLRDDKLPVTDTFGFDQAPNMGVLGIPGMADVGRNQVDDIFAGAFPGSIKVTKF